MRNTRLTGRERVARMFRREEQDSIPRHESFWPETYGRFRDEGLWESPEDLVGSDFAQLCWSDPKPYPGRSETVAEDEKTRTYVDEWGNTVRYWKGRSGTPEHVAFGCEDREEWEGRHKPALLAAGRSVDFAGAQRAYERGRRNGRWCHFTGLDTFEMLRRQLGDEVALIGMIEDPEWIRDVSATFTDLVLADFDALVEAGLRPDGVWIYGDMAYRAGPLCSPGTYRELVWPDHKRLADWAHAHDAPFIFHTDGDVNSCVPHYIDAGFDCLQPLEAKAKMDVRQLCPAYGDRLAFFGNVDVMLMAAGDRDVLEHEIRTKLEAGKETLGYAYHSDHSVPPSVSLETYRFVLDCVDRYGNYD